MVTYISLLKGINVSGHKPLKMDSLRKMYEKLDFENIHTYVQSGNVIFKSKEQDNKKIEQKISTQIEEEFGYKVPVVVFHSKKLKETINNNPFLRQPEKDPKFFHVTFLSSKPDLLNLEEIEAKKQAGEEIIVEGDVVYLYCPNGYGKTKLNNSFLERKLDVEATTRNWKTVNQLLILTK